MGLIIALSVTGYIICWIGSALFIIWGNNKWGEYLPFFANPFDDFNIVSIMCLLWPIIIIWFFATVLCGILAYRLEKGGRNNGL